jgi:hypothetical protein
VDLHVHYPTRLDGVALNWLITVKILPFISVVRYAYHRAVQDDSI